MELRLSNCNIRLMMNFEVFVDLKLFYFYDWHKHLKETFFATLCLLLQFSQVLHPGSLCNWGSVLSSCPACSSSQGRLKTIHIESYASYVMHVCELLQWFLNEVTRTDSDATYASVAFHYLRTIEAIVWSPSFMKATQNKVLKYKSWIYERKYF